MDFGLVGIAIGIGISGFILYTRKKYWSSPHIIWLATGILLTVGISGLLLLEKSNEEYRILCWGFCVPFFFYCFDRLFRLISLKVYQRDFILWLRGSDEIDYSFGASNPHVKLLDMIFSLSLFLLTFVIMVAGVIFFV